MIVTNNRKPVAILSSISEGSLSSIRRARTFKAVLSMQEKSARTGLDRLSSADIDKEIAEVRQAIGNEAGIFLKNADMEFKFFHHPASLNITGNRSNLPEFTTNSERSRTISLKMVLLPLLYNHISYIL